MSHELHVRWRVSPYDVRHGIPRDVSPHLVAAAVASTWLLAPRAGGSSALSWLGGAVLVLQLVLVGRLVVRHLRRWRRSEQVLAVRESSFVLTDRHGSTVHAAPLVGVLDDDGVLRLEFADGSVLEAPWRAFTHAGLRRLRRHLRARLGEHAGPEHVPVRTVGSVSGTAAWPRPVLSLVAAVVLALLPWLLPAAPPEVPSGGDSLGPPSMAAGTGAAAS